MDLSKEEPTEQPIMLTGKHGGAVWEEQIELESFPSLVALW